MKMKYCDFCETWTHFFSTLGHKMFTETSMGIFLEVNLAFFSALNYNSGTVNFFCDLMSDQGCVKTEKLSTFLQTLHNFYFFTNHIVKCHKCPNQFNLLFDWINMKYEIKKRMVQKKFLKKGIIRVLHRSSIWCNLTENGGEHDTVYPNVDECIIHTKASLGFEFPTNTIFFSFFNTIHSKAKGL